MKFTSRSSDLISLLFLGLILSSSCQSQKDDTQFFNKNLGISTPRAGEDTENSANGPESNDAQEDREKSGNPSAGGPSDGILASPGSHENDSSKNEESAAGTGSAQDEKKSATTESEPSALGPVENHSRTPSSGETDPSVPAVSETESSAPAVSETESSAPAVSETESSTPAVSETGPNSSDPASNEPSEPDPIVGTKDDGIGQVNEPKTKVCSEGKNMSLYLDLNNDGLLSEEDKLLGDFTAFKGPHDAKKNYNYYSYSAHPLIGSTPKGFESQLFFYEGSDGLSFNFIHSVDNGGSYNNKVHWNILVMGNKANDHVILSDDKNELKQKRAIPNHSMGNFEHSNGVAGKYMANFHYWRNTDGGIIGPFEGDEFIIHVESIGNGDNVNASFFSADGKILSLNDGDKIKSFFIKYRKEIICQNE